MNLKKIYFDAFKSLLNKELEVNHNCIGIVGINESGKSNVLLAINVLSGNRKLIHSDCPKMAKSKKPSLRFEFELSPEETVILIRAINEWEEKNTIDKKVINLENIRLVYNVIFNKETATEERFFTVSGIKLESNSLILLFEKRNDPYKIRHKESFIPLDNAIILKEDDISFDENHSEIYKALAETNEEILKIENEIKEHTAQIPVTPAANPDNAEPPATDNNAKVEKLKNADEALIKKQIEHLKKALDLLNVNKHEIETVVKDFNLPLVISNIKNSIQASISEISGLDTEIPTTQNKITELKKNAAPDDAQKLELTNTTKQLDELIAKRKTAIINKENHEKQLTLLNEPLKNKYTSDLYNLNLHLKEIVNSCGKDFLPAVVFWKHSNDYILQSETLFSDLLNKASFNEISRPLVNVFRIGLGTNTIDELKNKIREIQSDANERSRLQKILRTKVNNYVKSVWENYDQELNITLEKDQIRIEIFDPKPSGASYYNMEERSQGCQTFLSFLMTIGAEAMHGVIKNTILLLDEPETHLHPSGVKFMLKELLKISKSNTVIYATHSIFMIDRENYDRHIILKKEKEQTQITPSNIGRIGFFMQEEVLYNALDINLNTDFSSKNLYNFVFEGDGDAVLFDHFYNKVADKKNIPFPVGNSRFYQGGKCSDIEKYFTGKPIQLGTKWIFILDNDSPAMSLKLFLEGKYKDYIGKDIFVFQYVNAGKKDSNIDIEFEDLFEAEFMLKVYEKTFVQNEIPYKLEELKGYITNDINFVSYNEEIIAQIVPELNKDEFKGSFKGILNSEIREVVKNEEDFKKTFPLYFDWANEVLSSLKESVPKKALQKATAK